MLLAASRTAALLLGLSGFASSAAAQGRVYGPAGRPPRATLDSLFKK